jgi:hypothetical protein
MVVEDMVVGDNRVIPEQITEVKSVVNKCVSYVVLKIKKDI